MSNQSNTFTSTPGQVPVVVSSATPSVVTSQVPQKMNWADMSNDTLFDVQQVVVTPSPQPVVTTSSSQPVVQTTTTTSSQPVVQTATTSSSQPVVQTATTLSSQPLAQTASTPSSQPAVQSDAVTATIPAIQPVTSTSQSVTGSSDNTGSDQVEFEDVTDDVPDSPGEGADGARDHYPVFVVHSSYPLREIKRRLESYAKKAGLKSTAVGPLRIVRSRGQQTDKTVVIMDDKVYEELVKDGKERRKGRRRRFNLDDFEVRPYHLTERQRPKNRAMRHLMVRLPKAISRTECDKQLRNHMEQLVRFEILNEHSYQIAIPFESRESDNHIGQAFVVFEDDVNIWDIVISHSTLRESVWVNSKGKPLPEKTRWRHCFWAKITDPASIKMSPADRQRAIDRRGGNSKKTTKTTRSYNRNRRTRDKKPVVPQQTQIVPSNPVQYAPLNMVQPTPLRQMPPVGAQVYGHPPSYPGLTQSSVVQPPTVVVPNAPLNVPIAMGNVPTRSSIASGSVLPQSK